MIFTRWLNQESAIAGGLLHNLSVQRGLDKILKKVGEEATETIIAAKNEDRDRARQRDFRSVLSLDCTSG